jgi:peptide/nickel transport system substrate-binding protein
MRKGRTPTSVLALVVTVATGAAACSSSSPSGSSGAANGSGGKTLTVAMGALPSSADIDAKAASDAQTQALIAQSYAGRLFSHNVSPTGPSKDPNEAKEFPRPVPDLAQSAQLSTDGLTWTVTLREGVVSNLGNPLRPEDVVWSLQRALVTKQAAYLALTSINIDAAKPATAVGDRQVAIHLTSPSSVLEQVFSNPALGIYDSTAVQAAAGPSDPWGYEWTPKNTASYGAYELDTNELPNKVVLKANPRYWQGTPQVTRVTFVQLTDPSARLQSLLAGEVDVAEQIPQTDYPKVRDTAGVTPTVQSGAPIFLYGVFNLNNPETGTPAFRQALNASLDRDAMVKAALAGLGSPLTGCQVGGITSPKTPFDVQATPDIDRAKQLLAQAPGPRSVTIGYPTGIQGDSTIPQIMKANFATIGVTATLKPYASYSTFLADSKNGGFGIGIAGGRPAVFDGGYFYNAFFTTGSGLNVGSYSSKVFDAAVAKVTSTTGAAQSDALATVCTQFLSDQPALLLVAVNGLAAHRDRVTAVSGAGQQPIPYNVRVQ